MLEREAVWLSTDRFAKRTSGPQRIAPRAPRVSVLIPRSMSGSKSVAGTPSALHADLASGEPQSIPFPSVASVVACF